LQSAAKTTAAKTFSHRIVFGSARSRGTGQGGSYDSGSGYKGVRLITTRRTV